MKDIPPRTNAVQTHRIRFVRDLRQHVLRGIDTPLRGIAVEFFRFGGLAWNLAVQPAQAWAVDLHSGRVVEETKTPANFLKLSISSLALEVESWWQISSPIFKIRLELGNSGLNVRPAMLGREWSVQLSKDLLRQAC